MDTRSEYRRGTHLAICDRCGFKYHSPKLRKEWTGLMVCSGPSTNNCWEERHPQEAVRGKKDKQMPEWVRPEAPDQFVTPGPLDWNDY